METTSRSASPFSGVKEDFVRSAVAVTGVEHNEQRDGMNGDNQEVVVSILAAASRFFLNASPRRIDSSEL